MMQAQPEPQVYEALRVEGIDEQARGVATIGARVALIPGAAPGDVVDATIIATSQHTPALHARLDRVIERGSSHAAPPCPHAAPTRGQCGGCPAMHLTPDAQRDLKLGGLQRALEAHGVAARIPAPSWHDAPAQLGYRNRAHYVPARDDAGAAYLGGFAPRSHAVVDTRGCLIVRPAIDAAAGAISPLLDAHDVPLHPQPDALRHVTLRAAPDGRWVAELVLNAASPAWLAPLTAAIMALPGAVGVSCSLHDQPGNAIRVAAATLLAGVDALDEPLATSPPLTVSLTADGFFQLNAEVAAQMYSLAHEGRGDAPRAAVIWDLYCGVGGLGLVAAMAHGAALFGAESHARSVEQARLHAARHDVSATFEVIDLAKNSAYTSWPAPDLILVNPPRRGLDQLVLAALREQRGQLTYMSCNPVSFARDAAALLDAGWIMQALHAFDMLPQTTHVELLSRWTRP
jgi:23S rRNA (uracil-5-)-methyltransferase RumA